MDSRMLLQRIILIMNALAFIQAFEPVANTSAGERQNTTVTESLINPSSEFDDNEYGPFISDYDYFTNDDSDIFKVSSAKFWGCFQKMHAVIKCKSSDKCKSHAVSSTQLCERSCELNSKCKMWSQDGSPFENCVYVMAENSVEDQSIKYLPNADLGFKTCKSGYVGCHTNGDNFLDVGDYVDFVTHEESDAYSCMQKCKRNNYPFATFNLKYCACGYSFPTLQIISPDIECIQHDSNTTNSAIYKTGAQNSDTVLCIIAADLDYRPDHESSCTIVHELKSTLECKKKCQKFDERNCWMWSFNLTHCKLIPLSVSDKAIFVQKTGSFLGFRSCGDEDPIDSNDGAEIGHSAVVVIAFLIAIMLFGLVVALVCLKGRKNSEHRDSSEVTSKNESSKIEQNIHVIMSDIDGKNTNTGKPKKRYIDLMVNGTLTTSSTSSDVHISDNKDHKFVNGDPAMTDPLMSQNNVSEYISLDEWNNIKRENNGKIPNGNYSPRVENLHKTQNGEITTDENAPPKSDSEDEITISIVVHNETTA